MIDSKVFQNAEFLVALKDICTEEEYKLYTEIGLDEKFQLDNQRIIVENPDVMLEVQKNIEEEMMALIMSGTPEEECLKIMANKTVKILEGTVIEDLARANAKKHGYDYDEVMNLLMKVINEA